MTSGEPAGDQRRRRPGEQVGGVSLVMGAVPVSVCMRLGGRNKQAFGGRCRCMWVGWGQMTIDGERPEPEPHPRRLFANQMLVECQSMPMPVHEETKPDQAGRVGKQLDTIRRGFDSRHFWFQLRGKSASVLLSSQRTTEVQIAPRSQQGPCNAMYSGANHSACITQLA